MARDLKKSPRAKQASAARQIVESEILFCVVRKSNVHTRLCPIRLTEFADIEIVAPSLSMGPRCASRVDDRVVGLVVRYRCRRRGILDPPLGFTEVDLRVWFSLCGSGSAGKFLQSFAVKKRKKMLAATLSRKPSRGFHNVELKDKRPIVRRRLPVRLPVHFSEIFVATENDAEPVVAINSFHITEDDVTIGGKNIRWGSSCGEKIHTLANATNMHGRKERLDTCVATSNSHRATSIAAIKLRSKLTFHLRVA